MSRATQPAIRRATPLWLVLAGCTLLTVSGCSRRVLSVLFDVPSQDPAEAAAVQAAPAAGFVFADVDTVRPPIEDTLDPEVAKSLLPRDNAGNIDWMEALRTDVVKPRDRIPGESDPRLQNDFLFGYDFFYPNPVPMFDAYFPHSAHTQWVDCQQCHPRIFPHRGTDVAMADIVEGRFCGECHGKVAFPVATACERCHPAFDQPADRAVPDLIGNIRMKRVETQSDFSDSLAASNAGLATVFPEATFPHWIHRSRYTCKVCHMEIFEPVAGANQVTMKDIAEGQFCGRCHDGNTAFSYSFGNCIRCHQQTGEGMATK